MTVVTIVNSANGQMRIATDNEGKTGWTWSVRSADGEVLPGEGYISAGVSPEQVCQELAYEQDKCFIDGVQTDIWLDPETLLQSCQYAE